MPAALGLTYLADGSGDFDDLVYLTTSARGSLAATWLTLRAVGDGGAADGASGDGPEVETTPLGPVLVAAILASPSGPRLRAPLLRVRF